MRMGSDGGFRVQQLTWHESNGNSEADVEDDDETHQCANTKPIPIGMTKLPSTLQNLHSQGLGTVARRKLQLHPQHIVKPMLIRNKKIGLSDSRELNNTMMTTTHESTWVLHMGPHDDEAAVWFVFQVGILWKF